MGVSDLALAAPPRVAFSPKMMIALVLVGIFAFSGFTVLSVYAPDLRSGQDGGAHALSKSATGYAGAVALLKARDVPVVISRSPLTHATPGRAIRVLTPGPEIKDDELKAYDRAAPLLIVLPKWTTAPDPAHAGWVRKAGVMGNGLGVRPAKSFDDDSVLHRRTGVASAHLRGVGGPFAQGTYLPLGPVDQLQTLAGKNWRPVLVDEEDRIVLAQWKDSAVMVLADPDLLNTQGLKSLDTTRAGMAILDALRGEDGVAFDVSLNGFKRSRSVLRLMFEPPMLGATLCAVAATLLMGLHAVARFGPAASGGRAFALGKRALVDTSADLIRAARKEHELAPAYAALTEARTAKAAGERETDPAGRTERLVSLERLRRPADSLETLNQAARAARTRGETLSVAAKLFHWRSEMTRDRR
jgi:hypothetical protein